MCVCYISRRREARERKSRKTRGVRISQIQILLTCVMLDIVEIIAALHGGQKVIFHLALDVFQLTIKGGGEGLKCKKSLISAIHLRADCLHLVGAMAGIGLGVDGVKLCTRRQHESERHGG
eukprot:786932-Amorphochlora_amoeboformis.AAC.1